MPQFVVLHHEMPAGTTRGSHWDLMFEVGDVLATMAVAEPPGNTAEQTVDALPDHRKEYLDYEGSVSGGRGSVSRWDQGTYETLRRTDDAWEIRLAGSRIMGIAVITLADDSPGKRVIAWHLETLEEPSG